MGLARRRALSGARAGLLAACAAASLPAIADDQAAVRAGVIEAAAARGCQVRDAERDLTRLGPPHDGVIQVRCADSHIIWFEKVDGAWTVKPLG